MVSGDYQTNWPRSFHLKRMLITLHMVTTLPLIITPTNVKFTFYKKISHFASSLFLIIQISFTN